jgi:A/G-specific adenine glycosylase
MTTDEYFRRRVVVWATGARRQFPWRETRDPFLILMAELMLRRTRADQVGPVFIRFRERFPDPASLLLANGDDLNELLRPLGLAWRVPAFQLTARMLLEQFGGVVPRIYTDLCRLPGAGDYVASAVRAFAFNEAAVLVDTNTVRVAGRYFGFDYSPESRRNREVRHQVARLFDAARPRESARDLLDFASLICRARAPRCSECPVSAHCHYASVSGLPVRAA